MLRPGPNLGDEPRERLPIFVGRILLQTVKAFDRYGLLVRPGPAEVPRAADEKASGVGVDEEFRDRAGREPLALWRTKPLRGWKSGPVLSERRYKVRLSRLPALSIVFTSLAAGRCRISVGGLP